MRRTVNPSCPLSDEETWDLQCKELESREILDVFGSFAAGCISLSMVVLGAILSCAGPAAGRSEFCQ